MSQNRGVWLARQCHHAEQARSVLSRLNQLEVAELMDHSRVGGLCWLQFGLLALHTNWLWRNKGVQLGSDIRGHILTS